MVAHKSNLGPPSSDSMRALERIVYDLPSDGSGALIWTEEDGFSLKLPMLPENSPLPVPFYLLSLCFVRLTQDQSFAGELMDWSRRNSN